VTSALVCALALVHCTPAGTSPSPPSPATEIPAAKAPEKTAAGVPASPQAAGAASDRRVQFAFLCAGDTCELEVAPKASQLSAAASVERTCTSGKCSPNLGRLTEAGLNRTAAVAQSLLSTQDLAPVYGCPRCAGGSRFVIHLSAADETVRDVVLDPDDSQLPPSVADAAALMRALRSALLTCKASELVQSTEGCEAG